jgi:hypothetical protein
MTALATARLEEIDETAGLGDGISIVAVPGAAVEAAATRVLRHAAHPVKRFRAPPDPIELVRKIRASDEAQVIYGLDGREPAFWQAMDRLRDRLFPRASLFLVLSLTTAQTLARYAPNLASFADRMVSLDPAQEAEGVAADAQAQADFARLAAEWDRETAHHSSLARIVRHPAYQQIIAMGEAAIPPILRDLQRTHRPWGPALRAVTHANPVASRDAGKASKIAEAWLAWAEEKGYVW